MRILHVLQSMDPHHGGPPAVVRGLAREQQRKGAVVEIITRAASRELLRLSPSEDEDLDKEKAERLPLSRFYGNLQLQDLVHFHGVWEPLIRKGTADRRRQAKPYCVAPHGMLNTWSLRHKQVKKRIAFLLLYRRLLNGANFLQCLNAEEARSVTKVGIRVPLRVIPNGVDLEEIDSLLQQDRSDTRLATHRPYFLFVGRLHFVKGLDLLVRAFAALARLDTQVTLVIAGPDGGFRDALQALIRDHGLGARVMLVGPLYGAAKYAALKHALAFCSISRQEGFSLAILEALASGLPVIISKDCFFPEVEKNRAGLITQGSEESTLAAMLRILSEPGLRAELGANARKLVEKNYTWPSIAERSLRIYESVLKSG